MRLSLQTEELAKYVGRQFDHLFPDNGPLADLPRFVDVALARMEHCFSRIGLKGYTDSAGGARFSHLHTDQYAVFLYYLGNSAFAASPGHPIAAKAYALNKALHSIDIFYEVRLPDIFALQHPVGTVLGRASYADYFFCYQNCTVGSNLAGEYPTLGRGVVMYGGSRIIGRTRILDNTLIAAGAVVQDRTDLPANSIVHGMHPNVRSSPSRRDVVRDIFRMTCPKTA
jgi:serine O-acetyltransferase